MVKTILITGATDGIGKHLAKKLASEGHRVLIHGRNPEKLAKTVAELKAISPRGAVRSYQADFSNMSDVYNLARQVKEDYKQLDVLFNNAGLYAGNSRQTTKEGVEITFMLSVLVPYVLAEELRPLLEASDQGRVINTSSFMHHFARPKGLDFSLDKKYSPALAYNNAKLYTIWLTRYQAQLWKAEGSSVTINSYHPGLIATNLGNDTSDEKVKKSLYGRLMKKLSKDLDEGIVTGEYLTLSSDLDQITGAYFDDKKQKHVSYKGYTTQKAQALINYCQESISKKLF